jgi:hypothetical protein
MARRKLGKIIEIKRGEITFAGQGMPVDDAGQEDKPFIDEAKVWGLRPRKHPLTGDVNKGGRKSDRSFIRKLALRHLKEGNYSDREEDFAAELERWFATHDHSLNNDPKASTIEGHIRDLWRRRHQWPQRRSGIPPS